MADRRLDQRSELRSADVVHVRDLDAAHRELARDLPAAAPQQPARIGQIAAVIEPEGDVPLERHEVTELLAELLRTDPPPHGTLLRPHHFDRLREDVEDEVADGVPELLDLGGG